MVEISRGLSE